MFIFECTKIVSAKTANAQIRVSLDLGLLSKSCIVQAGCDWKVVQSGVKFAQ
jgi:hypothetical protein